MEGVCSVQGGIDAHGREYTWQCLFAAIERLVHKQFKF